MNKIQKLKNTIKYTNTTYYCFQFLGHITCMQCIDAAYCYLDVVHSVVRVCVLGTWVSCTKMAWPIMMPFADWLMWVKEPRIRWGSRSPTWRGTSQGECAGAL